MEEQFAPVAVESEISNLKIPPHSIEAEQSVLGGLLLSSESWERVADLVSAGDFYRSDHRSVFSVMAKLAEADQPLDVITVADALRSFSSEIILKACRSAIAESEYLPSLHVMHRHCRNQLASFGLTDALSAYREACNASSPKCNYDWSHPAVYYAGQACEWRLLASETESQMLPIFERHYQSLCEEVLSGKTLESPAQLALPNTASGKSLSQEENRRRLKALRDQARL